MAGIFSNASRWTANALTGGGGTNRSSSPSGFTQGTGQSFASTPTSPPSRYTPSPFKSAFDLYTAMSGPAFQNSLGNTRIMEAQQGVMSANHWDNVGFAQGDYNLAMRGLGLDQQALGIQRANAGIDLNSANRDIGYFSRLLGLMPQYRNLSREDFDNTLARLAREGTMERRGISSDYTGRGNFFAPMHRVGLDNSRTAQSQAETAARIGFDRDNLGLTEKEWGLDRSRSQAGDAAGRAQNQMGLFDIEAQKLGLTGEKYRAQLDQTLAQLGYSNFMSAAELEKAIKSSKVETAQLGMQILDQVHRFMQGAQSGELGNIYQRFG